MLQYFDSIRKIIENNPSAYAVVVFNREGTVEYCMSRYAEQGFAWLDRGQTFPCVYAVRRSGGGETLAALFNFSEEPQSYALSGLHSRKRPEMLLHSDWEAFGGKIGESEKIAQSISLPAFSGVLLRIEE